MEQSESQPKTLRIKKMKIPAFLQNWNFDLKVVFLTLFASPLVFYFVTIIKKYVKDWGTYVLEGLMFYAARFFHENLAGRLTLKQYSRLRLGEDNKYLYVPSSLDVKLEVDTAFVTLSLEHHGGQRSIYDHRNILSIGNRIRVIGDPGSGKSSLVKKLMRDACRQAISSPKAARLPILIELKRLQVPSKKDERELGTWLVQKIRTDVAKNDVYQMEKCFDTYAKGAGLLILLDGLDEVSSADYPRVHSAIEGLSKKLSQQSSKNIIVLTMRTQFHQQVKESYRENFGHALTLRPFTPTDIYEFLSRWPFRDNGRNEMNRIFKDLTDRSSLREMCSNPLVLSMYVAEDQASGHLVAPDSRTEFYKKVTDELLIKRRLAQTGPALAHTKLREQRERILGKVAYDHMLNPDEPANSLSWKAAIEVISEVMKCDESQAAEIFREISKETGLITEERSNETFRFIHLTLCEFLAAYEAVHGQANGWKRLIEIHKSFQDLEGSYLRSRLMEVIPFACGLLPRVMRKEAINDIVILRDNGLLARSFVETKLYDHDAWPIFVESWKAKLLGVTESDWNDEWLRELHLFNVVVRDANLCATHMVGAVTAPDLDKFFETLVNKQRESLSTLLGAYASQDAVAAFRLAEISRLNLASDFPEIVLANCDQAPFLALVLEQALRELDRINLWAPLLSEAALRSRVVGRGMFVMSAAKEWGKFLLDVPKSKRWTDSKLVGNNFYTQCLTIALKPNVEIKDHHVLLKIIQAAPNPRSYWFVNSIALFLLFFAIFAVLPLFTILRAESIYSLLPIIPSKPVEFITLSVSILFGMVAYYFIFKTVALRLTYRQLLYGFRSRDIEIAVRGQLLGKVTLILAPDILETVIRITLALDKKLHTALKAMSTARLAIGATE